MPGVRLNVSSRGVSATIGGAGITFTTPLTTRSPAALPPSATEPSPALLPRQRVEIQSASTYELASEALSELRKLISDAAREQEELDRELAAAEPDANAKSARYEQWSGGIILQYVFKKKFATIASDAEEATARAEELREQRRLASISTHIEMAEALRRPFGRLCDAFSRLSESQRIWDTLAIQKTDRFRERTTAVHSIERKLVRFALSASDLLVCEWNVPRLANANGGDLYLYPGFVLYRVSRQSFAVIDAREVRLNVAPTRFIEEEGVPADSEVVGQSWKKANKDGSPDRRFAANYQIPVVRYAEVAFTTPSGLNEVYLISNYAAAEEFGKAWAAYAATFEPH